MKRRKLLTLLLLASLFVPALATAQIIIDRINETDPTRPLVKKTDEGSEENGEDEEAEKLDEDELEEVRAVLIAQLKETHANCMKMKEVRRPEKGKVSGSSTWEITDKGEAKFKDTSVSVNLDMFVSTDKELGLMSDVTKEAATERANEIYKECAKGADAEVPVEGKSQDVSLQFEVTWEKNKAVVEVQD